MKLKGLVKFAGRLVEMRNEYQARLQVLNEATTAKAAAAAESIQNTQTADSLIGLFTSVKA
jgi:hypothetical protein